MNRKLEVFFVKIIIKTDGDIAMLVLSGNLVASSAGELTGHVSVLVESGFIRILLDMGNVKFMDSMGLQTCIAMNNLVLKNKGALVYARPSKAVTRVLDITKAQKKLTIVPDRKAGIDLLSKQG